MRDGRHYTVVEGGANGETDLYRVEARSGNRALLIRGRELVPPGQSTPIRIENYQFSPDGSKLLIFTNSVRVWRQNTKGMYYLWDFARRSLTALSTRGGFQQFAKFSPDGRYVGFVRDHNLFVHDLQEGSERQLTHDGDEHIINGTADWVYEEELDLRDAFRFSPDGKRIAFWRLDQSAIRPFYLIDETSLYPLLKPVRYPKAGTQNSEVRLGVVETETGAISWIDLGPEREIYVAEMGFTGRPTEIWFTRLNRHQNRLDVMLADVRTGASRTIMTDRDSAWVDAAVPTWLDGGRQFVFPSERDGIRQLYLFDQEGKLIRKITPTAWDVTELYGVDEPAGIVYFSGAGEGSPTRSVYRVGLNGRNVRRLSSGSGWHAATFNPQFDMYVGEFSTAAVPPRQMLHSADGRIIRVIADNAGLAAKLEALAFVPPEFTTVPGHDGELLNGYLIKPRDFDPSREYPLLMYVYGGPGSQTVVDRWGGSRYLWHQMLVSEGYLVASVDNRGTGARGRAFKKMTYLQLGQYESQDQIAAARHFASLSYVDGDRMGIWGWSYGGYMSLLSMFQGAGTFRAAISVAPVTDWRLYDTIYTERYMRTPQENPDGYERGAPLSYVDRLTGKLLVVHGTGDDNVHSQNTTLLIQRLEDAGKQFDMRLYPNKTHAIGGATSRMNVYGLFTRWLNENLRQEPAAMSLQP
jgi:dipeptidyl-peptidase-4